MPVKGIYLAGAGIGSVMLYAGFKGKKWTDVTHALVSGQNPTTVGKSYGISTAQAAFQATAGYGGSFGGIGGGTATGQQIAEDALLYKGAGYVWAGAPGGGHSEGHWDCSSFANAVIGRDLGMAIPMYKAGSYHGQAHGPNTLIWLAWPGAKRVPLAQASAGDLAIWQTHMGIVIDQLHMISALNSQLGTQVTTIHGGAPPGEIVTIKQLVAAR
jgi:cell wall-associated NlpC family hydrolase